MTVAAQDWVNIWLGELRHFGFAEKQVFLLFFFFSTLSFPSSCLPGVIVVSNSGSSCTTLRWYLLRQILCVWAWSLSLLDYCCACWKTLPSVTHIFEPSGVSGRGWQVSFVIVLLLLTINHPVLFATFLKNDYILVSIGLKLIQIFL